MGDCIVEADVQGLGLGWAVLTKELRVTTKLFGDHSGSGVGKVVPR
jgi:hypothetical protein